VLPSKVVEHNRAFAHPDAQWKTDARGLKAHVGAIGEFVGFKPPDKYLLRKADSLDDRQDV
jgi:hypothetical protein